MKSVLRALALLLLVMGVAISPAAATTYQMISDQALADQAAAVVAVRVVGAEFAPIVDGPPATDYLVEVNRVLKGDLAGSTVVVRVPGGVNPTGLGLRVWGAPRFQPGEEAILFLRAAQDGTYRILHLMLGAFHRRVHGDRAVALRDLSEAHEIGSKGGVEGNSLDAIREFDRFSDWVADRAQDVPNDGGYLLGKAKAELGSISDSFTFLTPNDGTPIRWFSFDGRQNVQWSVHTGGQPGLDLGATIAAFQSGIDAWVADAGTNIQYAYAGTTAASGGLASFDGVNSILFDDPYRDDPDEAVEGTFSCGDGGVIAIGGPWFYESTRLFRGKRYHEAAEADIVTNDGTECYFRDNPRVAEEVFAHELGHTLGLGHSEHREALMFSRAHGDGRGALLSADDRAAVAVLYGAGSASGPVRGAPVRLTARAPKSTEVALTWRDKAIGEESYRVEAKQKGKPWQEVLSLPAGATSTEVTDLLPGTVYSFRVRAEGGGRFSRYSNVVTVTTPR
jgi:fibronectin type III domain protein/matrixin